MPQLLFPDSPNPGDTYPAPNGVTYTYDNTVGTGVWTAAVTTGFVITSPGTITGTAQVGSTLSYTPGTYTGGVAPITDSWEWRRESDNSVLQTGGNNYILVAADAGDRVYVKYIVTDSTPTTVNQDTAAYPTAPALITQAPFPTTVFSPSTGPNASPASVNLTTPSVLKGTAVGSWADGSTNLTSTGSLQFQVAGGGYGQGPTPVVDTNAVDIIWDPTAVSAAADGAILTGTLTDGTYVNSYSFTVNKKPNAYSFTDVTNAVLSTLRTSNTITPAGFNVPITLSAAGGVPNALTTPQGSVAGAIMAAFPLTVNPGDTIQVEGITGGTASTAYTLDVTLGSGTNANDTWSVTTTSGGPVVNAPTITAPANGATGLNPTLNSPEGLTLTSSAYSASGGAGTHASSDWEVYKNSYPLTSTNSITAVTQGKSGAWIAAASSPTTSELGSIGVEGSTFIAVRFLTPQVYRSTDGATSWTTSFTGSTGQASLPNALAYHNGAWALGSSENSSGVIGRVYMSYDDGVTWTLKTTGTSGNGSAAVVYGANGIWNAAGNTTTTAGWRKVSTDNGLTWTTASGIATGTGSGIRSFIYRPAGGIWLACQFSGGAGNVGRIWRSTDNTTYTVVDSTAAVSMNAFADSGSLFVCVGDSGKILTSPDGNTWTARTSGVTTVLNSVTYANGVFVAVGDGGKILISVDGITWTASTSGTTQNLNKVVYGNGHFWACGAAGTLIKCADPLSTLGTYAQQTSPTTAALASIGIAGSTAIITTVTPVRSYRSTNGGSTWDAGTLLSSVQSTPPNSLFYYNGVWAIGTQAYTSGVTGKVFMSYNDGVTWTAKTSGTGVDGSASVVYGANNIWNAAGLSSSTTAGWRKVSTDNGATWTTASGIATGAGGSVISMIYRSGVWIACQIGGNAGRIWRSTDNTTYTLVDSSAAVNMNCLADSGSLFVCVGDSGKILTSPDGTTWTARTSGITTALESVAYGDGMFVAVGAGGKILTSTDGITWSSIASPTTQTLNKVIFNDGYFWIAGAAGVLLKSTPLTTTLAIAGCAADGFLVGDTIVSVPAAAGPATITAVDNVNVTVRPQSTAWAAGQKITRATSSYTQIVPPPANPNSTNLVSLPVAKASLLPSTKYWARVRYTSNATVATSDWSPWSSFTTSSIFAPAIGAPYKGGYFAGQIKVFAGQEGGGLPVTDKTYNLIVAPRVSGTLEGQYGGAATLSTLATKTANTADLPATTSQNAVYGGLATAAFSGATYPGYNWVKTSLTGPNKGTYDITNAAGTGIGGYNDWYIPALNELNVLYYYLKGYTNTNDTAGGSNPNALAPQPIGVNFTATDPPITTANGTGGTGDFLYSTTGAQRMANTASPSDNRYMSSTEAAAGTQDTISFLDGSYIASSKTTAVYVRAVRRELA